MKVQCFNCGKYGHYRNERWSNKYENKETHANVAENNDKQETLLFSTSEDEENKLNDWFLDSGCSNHMRGKKELFFELDESFKSYVMKEFLCLEREIFLLL